MSSTNGTPIKGGNISSPKSGQKPLQAPRGCPDIFPDEVAKRQLILKQVRECVRLYGYKEHETPIFEHAEVFLKSLGDDTDIINKEMYSFTDKGGENFVLRPEATASIARLFISHKLFRELPYKVFYQGPMFRHERPQKGRLRQFNQLGIECLGAQKNPIIDAETIAVGWRIIKHLGLENQSQILINSLGQLDERKAYRAKLVEFLKDQSLALSEDSQKRLTTNPLRILDSKDETDQKILAGAPILKDFLTDESLAYIDKVAQHLKNLNIAFTYDSKLVRGLDYYCDTVFEIQNSNLGAQATLLAGGRYDGLIPSMGGPETSGIGWAAGLERLALVADVSLPQSDLVGVVDMTGTEDKHLLQLSEQIRDLGYEVYYSLTGNFSKQLKKCESKGCKRVVIFGPDEIKNQTVQIKDLTTGEQKTLPLKDLKSLKAF